MNLELKAGKINREIKKRGFDSFLVGGCVRDSLLNIEAKDFDISSNAPVEVLREIFGEENVVGIGLKSLDVGVVGVKIDGDMFEVAKFRSESYTEEGGRIPTTEFIDNIEEDLARRDFTVNAMALDTETNIITDPFGGCEDLDNKIIRAVGNPVDRFNEDSLRMLRAARFVSTKGFDIEENTLEAMKRMAHKVQILSQERIRMEIEKIVMGKNTKKAFTILHETGILKFILPELDRVFGFDQNSPWHEFTLDGHILTAVENSERILEVRLALLFHDIGKQDCETRDEEGISHFMGHDRKSAKIAREILERLKFNKKTIELVTGLIELHMIRFSNFKNRGMRKIVDRLGEENVELLFKVWIGDENGHTSKDKEGLETTFERIKRLRDFVSSKEKNVRIKDLKVTGNDFKSSFKGKEIGFILKALLNAVLSGQILNKREELLKFVETIEIKL